MFFGCLVWPLQFCVDIYFALLKIFTARANRSRSLNQRVDEAEREEVLRAQEYLSKKK